MLDHAREAMALVQGKTRADLDSDRLLNLALVRLLEIIGEAANRISEEEQARHPEIPWPQIVSLGMVPWYVMRKGVICGPFAHITTNSRIERI
jgi:uncharacterized protein with HEPN domain